jgi:RNA polymerase sigma factor (sigma-70 family)
MTQEHSLSQPREEALRQELLVVRCQLGEREAFDELVERWHLPIWRYVRRLVSDDSDAEEITQEVWLRILRGILALGDPAGLPAWIFTIARRTVMDRLRSRYAQPALVPLEEEETSALYGTEEPDLRWMDEDILEQALLELSPMEREVLVLFHLRELSLREVAVVLGVPTGTVKSRLSRARTALEQLLRRKGSDQ